MDEEQDEEEDGEEDDEQDEEQDAEQEEEQDEEQKEEQDAEQEEEQDAEQDEEQEELAEEEEDSQEQNDDNHILALAETSQDENGKTLSSSSLDVGEEKKGDEAVEGVQQEDSKEETSTKPLPETMKDADLPKKSQHKTHVTQTEDWQSEYPNLEDEEAKQQLGNEEKSGASQYGWMIPFVFLLTHLSLLLGTLTV